MALPLNPGPAEANTPNIGGGAPAVWANSAGTALIGPTGTNVVVGGGGAGISAGTQSVSTGTVAFANSNGVTFGMSGSNQITASVNAQGTSVAAFYDGANSISSGTVSFAAANGVTFSINGQTLSASVASQTNQTIGGYAVSNTTGGATSTTIDARSVSINAYGAISAGFNAGSLQLSAPATSSLVGINGISVSTNASTISILPAPLSRQDFWPYGVVSSGQQANGTASFRYIQLVQPVTFSRVDVPGLISLSSAGTTATADLNFSSGLFIYSRNGSTLSPITGSIGSTTYTWASNSANWSSLTGGKNFSFALGGSLSAGEYWIGFQLSTTNNSSIGLSTTLLGNTISVLLGQSYTVSQIGDMGNTYASSQNAVSQGINSVTITATNMTIPMSNITAIGVSGMSGNFPVIFRNY